MEKNMKINDSVIITESSGHCIEQMSVGIVTSSYGDNLFFVTGIQRSDEPQVITQLLFKHELELTDFRPMQCVRARADKIIRHDYSNSKEIHVF
jgi:hypothetical protein